MNEAAMTKKSQTILVEEQFERNSISNINNNNNNNNIDGFLLDGREWRMCTYCVRANLNRFICET